MESNEQDDTQKKDFLIEDLDVTGKEISGKNSKTYEPENLMPFEEVKKLDEKFVLNTYARMPVCFAYGSGEFLYDAKGKEYIDFLSGIAVTAVGHVHADLVGAISHQADMLWHSSNLFYNQQQALLARALVEISFPGKVFFCNSGTEANEAAIKLMRAHGVKTNKKTILSLKNSFHGRTFGAMSITGQSKIHDGFGPLMSDVQFVEPNNIKELEGTFNNNVAGIIMEPIQGEGGVIPLDFDFVQKTRELCNTHKAIMVLDEIQTGMGRTGKYFAYEKYNILPDVVTLAKGLGGGFPIGAMIVSDNFTDVFKSGSHGSTFGGNHLATAVGYEVLRIMESGKVLENVDAMSTYLFGLLENLKAGYPEKVKEIRGRGLLIGIVLDESIEARPLVQKALEKHLVIGRAADNVLRLAPPLIVREHTIDRAIEKIEEIIREIKVS
jgi:predicted acetylornithine/succinylornithine family transaminase